MPALSPSALIPQVELPDLGRVTLPDGTRLDLRFLDNTAEHAINTTADVGVSLVFALLIITGGWVLSNWVARTTQSILIRAQVEETVAAFIGSVARYVLFFSCVLAGFQIIGISIISAVAVFGAIGLAIAFALRNTLSHVAAGLMLIINRPFRVGDYIELDDVEGTVKRITLFNTELNTLSNQRVFLPNSKIWENTLLNHTYNEVRMIEYIIPLPIHTPLKTVRAAIKPMLEAHPLILTKPEPLVGYDRLEAGNQILVLRVWLKTSDYLGVRYTLLDECRQALTAAGLTPAAPALLNVYADTPSRPTPAPMKGPRHAR